MPNHPGRDHLERKPPDERAEAEAAEREKRISFFFIAIETVLVLALIGLTIGKFYGVVSEVIVDSVGLAKDSLLVVLVIRSLLGSFRAQLEIVEKLHRGNVVLSQSASSEVQSTSSNSLQK